MKGLNPTVFEAMTELMKTLINKGVKSFDDFIDVTKAQSKFSSSLGEIDLAKLSPNDISRLNKKFGEELENLKILDKGSGVFGPSKVEIAQQDLKESLKKLNIAVNNTLGMNRVPLAEIIDVTAKAIKYGYFKLEEGIVGLRKFLKSKGIDEAKIPDEDLHKVLDDINNKIDLDNYLSQFKKIPIELNKPIEFGGELIKRDNVDLYILGKTKGSKIVGGNGSYAGTLNIEDIDGVKLLKEEMPQRIKNKFPDSFEDQTKAYWEEINQPWLDEAIENGADIRFIQDPRLEENVFHIVTDKQRLNPLFKNITKHKTYLRFEYEYLVNKGYKMLDNGLMIKIN